MKISALLALLLISCALAAPLAAQTRNVTDPQAPRSLETANPVSVSWDDPARFTEIRHSRNRWDAQRGDWVQRLAEHLQERASEALPVGQRMQVRITDITRAGDYEPWHGMNLRDVRVMRDIYPPRLSLEFIRYDAAGQLIAQGKRDLADMGYLSGGSTLDSDPLRFEKRLIDDWIRRELREEPRELGSR